MSVASLLDERGFAVLDRVITPGTHRWRKTPQDSMQDCNADHAAQRVLGFRD